MRRFFLGMAIASLTAGAPLTAFGGDREIADAIVTTLKQKQTDGTLKGFDIDLSVDEGKVVVAGTVANQGQLDSVLQVASVTPGVKLVENRAVVLNETPIVLNDTPIVLNETPIVLNDLPTVLPIATVAKPEYVMPASANEQPAPALLNPFNGFANEAEPKVSPADAAVTSEVLGRLGSEQSAGKLRNFEIDVSTVNGEVWTRGFVATQEQKNLILGTIQRVPGVRKVIDDVSVNSRVQKASTGVGTQAAGPSGMPVVGSGAPRAFAPSMLANGSMVPGPMRMNAPMNAPMNGGMMGGMNGGMMGGMPGPAAPVPMQPGPGYGAGVPRYDQPNMPNHAWPSYAAYPNYAAVTYPKQYSASAWPYIGPFYPYPQVPLGWRKVALEWDDGLWYLDFTHKK